MLSLIALAQVLSNYVVARDIYADPSAIAAQTRGLVRYGRVRLSYDLAALPGYDVARPVRERGGDIRLSYAGIDELGLTNGARELDMAHRLAADIVRDEADRSGTAMLASR